MHASDLTQDVCWGSGEQKAHSEQGTRDRQTDRQQETGRDRTRDWSLMAGTFERVQVSNLAADDVVTSGPEALKTGWENTWFLKIIIMIIILK